MSQGGSLLSLAAGPQRQPSLDMYFYAARFSEVKQA
jgi:hypothetical protein